MMIEINKPYVINKENKLTCWISYNSWNNFGYYTAYQVNISKNENVIARGWFHIIKKDQEINEKQWDEIISPISFSTDLEFAERLFVLCTVEERKKIVDFLNVQLDRSEFWKEPAFRISILRNKTLENFRKDLSKFKYYIMSPIDICDLLVKFAHIYAHF